MATSSLHPLLERGGPPAPPPRIYVLRTLIGAVSVFGVSVALMDHLPWPMLQRMAERAVTPAALRLADTRDHPAAKPSARRTTRIRLSQSPGRSVPAEAEVLPAGAGAEVQMLPLLEMPDATAMTNAAPGAPALAATAPALETPLTIAKPRIETIDPAPAARAGADPVVRLPIVEGGGPRYGNCAEARRAGVAPMHIGEAGYAPWLDGDGDGIACEPYYGR